MLIEMHAKYSYLKNKKTQINSSNKNKNTG